MNSKSYPAEPNNTGALYALMAIIGASSLTLLELAPYRVRVWSGINSQRRQEFSSVVVFVRKQLPSCFLYSHDTYCSRGNVFGAMFVLANDALRAPATAHPPLNMHRSLIFQSSFICGCALFILFLKGKQVRRELDELKDNEGRA